MSPANEILGDFLRMAATAMANASLYVPDHPQVKRLCQDAVLTLNEILATRGEVSLLVADGELIFEGRPLERTLQAVRLVQSLQSRGIGHLRLRKGLSAEELQGLVLALITKGSGEEVSSTDHIRLGTIDAPATGETQEEKAESEKEIPDIFRGEITRFLEIYEAVKKRRKLNMVGISEMVAGFIAAFRQESDPLLALSPLKIMDEYTFTHSTNVCVLNLAQAMSLGIDGPQLHEIGVAAMLHDIGKLFVPEEVLNKTEKLTDADWELIRQHPLKGAQYLLDEPGVPRLAVVTAFEHHRKFDGSGYPNVEHRWPQNLCSQMTAVSDTFDALRTKRPYRESMATQAIEDILNRVAGESLNPVLTRNFLRIMSRLEGQA